MSKPLSYPAWKSGARCRRCGHKLQRHDRSCDVCGAFNFAEIGYDQRSAVAEEQLSPDEINLRRTTDLMSEAMPPDRYRYQSRSYASPENIPKGRTLSLRSAMAIACAAGILAGGLTYWRFGMPGAADDSGDYTRPIVHADADTQSDDSASVAYMSPKALREIQDTLDEKHTDGSQSIPALRDQNLSRGEYATNASHYLLPPPSESTSPNSARNRQPRSAMPAPENQQSVAAQAFSDSRDPDALERAIKQYGWRTETRTNASH